ncbi:MAG: T9SS type A sorting domain-containing protein [Bacteroidota bacterium]
MNIKNYSFGILMFTSLCMIASEDDLRSGTNRHDIRYIKNTDRVPDVMYQQELRERSNWKNFVAANGTWYVQFNQENAKPHRAFGQPIPAYGIDAQAKAMNFITSKLGSFNIPLNELSYRSTSSSENFQYVHFNQVHNGLKVLDADLYIKLTPAGSVVTFGCDVYNDITISTSPVISSADAIQFAKVGLANNTITGATINNDLFILPIPEFKQNIYKLVYEVTVETMSEGIPARYYTLVDAEKGTVLYRQNKVNHHQAPELPKQPVPANTNINITATVSTTHPYNASSVQPLRNLKMAASSVTYNTDATGFIGLTNTAPVSVVFSLEGLWSKVRTGTTTPTYTVTANPGNNNFSFNANANIRQLTSYYHVNIVHDYMKTKFPSFTSMDNPLQTNVDLTSGTCNAFYNGSSINFYAKAGGCNCLGQVGDVVYHEYGHGINDKFYQSQGASFNNGGMNEGYADIWAMGITNNPVVGIGFSDTDPNVFIRRYDIGKKVYPQDLVGQVHADGEIIAGAWWDTNLNFGNLQKMMDLFKETFYATVSGPNGSEGQVFVDVLIEALTSDDIPANGGDNNIQNGTPNDIAIVDAFALHGITLLSNANITHTDVKTSPYFIGIPIDANITGTYAWANPSPKIFYKLNRTGAWSNTTMTLTSGTNYTATIPGQAAGTVLGYYIALEDKYGKISGVRPAGANMTNPNIPYFILVGVALNSQEDFDNFIGSWFESIPSDDATTGRWIVDVPVGSYSTPGDPSTVVQPDAQNTPGGMMCAVTGNAPSTSDALGTNDVDGGETTLVSPVYDLSTYSNPIFTYYRWYINNPPTSANPGNDYWETQISNDGTTWIKIERTNVSDKSWRRFAFRVKDYVTLSSTVSLRFVVEDSVIAGLNLTGGSIVEGALDDLYLYEAINTVGIDEQSVTGINVYPNPANNVVNVSYELLNNENVKIELINNIGQVVYSQTPDNSGKGMHTAKIDTDGLATGIYMLNIKTGEQNHLQKVNVIK